MLQISPEDASLLVVIADQRGAHTEYVREQLLPMLHSEPAKQVAELLINPSEELLAKSPKPVRLMYDAYRGWVEQNTVPETDSTTA